MDVSLYLTIAIITLIFLCIKQYGIVLIIGTYIVWFILGDFNYLGFIKSAVLIYLIVKIADISIRFNKEKN